MLDVLIAGGGANGLVLALALSQQTELKIGIVEAKAYQQAAEQQKAQHPAFDARVIALAKASEQILLNLGLSELSANAQPIEQIHVSDRGHLGQCQLNHTDYQLDALGYVVELEKLGQLLQQKLQTLSERQLQWYCPDTIASIEQHQDHNQVALQSGKSLKSKLIVVAEGGQSPTRALLKLDATAHDYEQVGLIANVTLDRDHQNIAYERFTEFGPLALLPMQPKLRQRQHQYSLVWAIPPEQQAAFLALSDQAILAKLQAAFGYRAGRFVSISQRHCYPLALVQAQTFVGHRCVLLGNSAQSLHPIAGQGLNLGLRDVQALNLCLQNAESEQQGNHQKDVGSYTVLQRYQQQRQADKDNTIGLTHNLVKLFSNQHVPLVMGRNMGLFALQLMPMLKSQFAQHTTGLTQLNRMPG